MHNLPESPRSQRIKYPDRNPTKPWRWGRSRRCDQLRLAPRDNGKFLEPG
ncbi:hypothetical protein IQ273_24980 [Nodosilinea sp. LEGE 07298]|nr:hypothetical protein [Nodosilinea sp. LEGE 07298]MBE9112650.1 hypothetical protein [Nodosilinea sp. LEGE 07298]